MNQELDQELTLDVSIDVSAAAGLGEAAHLSVTVSLPEPDALLAEPIVCFGKPGGGYAKGYFTVDLPGPGSGSQAGWHTDRGWVFVSVDHLGVGASSVDHDPTRLDYTTLANAAQAAETEILFRLASGTLLDGYPKIDRPLKLGIGQSMGGCLTVVQQGRHHCYDGIGVLGYSAVHTHPPVRPGEPPIVAPWLPRDRLIDEPLTILNGAALAAAQRRTSLGTEIEDQGMNMAWGFFWDDVDLDTVRPDLVDFPTRNGNVPPWASATMPGAVSMTCLTPGAIAAEAAAVTSPVLAAFGQRDVCADPKGEPRAYL
jgi:hypothetical protein